MEVLVIQHNRLETSGVLGPLLAGAGITETCLNPYAGDAVPNHPGKAAGLVVAGGPMAVYAADRYPYLVSEMRLIEAALHANIPVLGICLGSQLLASVLGATVRPGGKKEIGWRPISLTGPGSHDPLFAGLQKTFLAFHWHGDIFDLPLGALPLASSDLTACQGFRHGCGYGLLFHLEVTRAIIAGLASSFATELEQEGLSAERLLSMSVDLLPGLHSIAGTVFTRWVKSLRQD